MITTFVLRLLIVLDCILNMLLRGSINQTLSARAHDLRSRGHKYWGWTANCIDWLPFWSTSEHCRLAFVNEQENGGALYWVREMFA